MISDGDRWRMGLVFSLIAIATIAVMLHGPIPQDPAYHQFADQRTLCGIPNFWNVCSNLPFLVVGAAGLFSVFLSAAEGALPGLRPAYFVFFVGSALVALGSAYYHLDPNNSTLVWDRLPMTVAFMAFASVIIGEHVSQRAGRLALIPLLAMGILSVLVWRVTEAKGHGDLRLYVLVQYLPALVIPALIVLFPSRLTRVYLIWFMLAAYALAKVLEALDRPLFAVLPVSGHTLKHLVAAAGLYLLVVAIRVRRPRA